jgi:hypothetical protein
MLVLAIIGTALLAIAVFFKVLRGCSDHEEFTDTAGNLLCLTILMLVLVTEQGGWAVVPTGMLAIFHNFLHYRRL